MDYANESIKAPRLRGWVLRAFVRLLEHPLTPAPYAPSLIQRLGVSRLRTAAIDEAPMHAMIYSLVLRNFVGGTLCAGIGLLVISAYYLRAWRTLQDRANVIGCCIPGVQVSLRRQHWPELRYLQWGVSSSVLFFMLAGAADTENDWLFRVTGCLMGFCAALSFAMFGVGLVCLWNLWKELAWQLKRAKVGSLLLSIPRAGLWLALGLGVMLLAGMLVEKIEKLPKLWQLPLSVLLRFSFWVLIAQLRTVGKIS